MLSWGEYRAIFRFGTGCTLNGLLQPASAGVNGNSKHKSIRNGNQIQQMPVFRKRLKMYLSCRLCSWNCWAEANIMKWMELQWSFWEALWTYFRVWHEGDWTEETFLLFFPAERKKKKNSISKAKFRLNHLSYPLVQLCLLSRKWTTIKIMKLISLFLFKSEQCCRCQTCRDVRVVLQQYAVRTWCSGTNWAYINFSCTWEFWD